MCIMKLSFLFIVKSTDKANKHRIACKKVYVRHIQYELCIRFTVTFSKKVFCKVQVFTTRNLLMEAFDLIELI